MRIRGMRGRMCSNNFTFVFLGTILVIFFLCSLKPQCVPSLTEQKVIFVGGVPRSGTTLMRALLDAHPDIRCGEETHIIPMFMSMVSRWDNPAQKQRLDFAGVSRKVINGALGEFIGSVIKNHGPPAEIYCNKDPLSFNGVRRLAEIFPHGRFVLMVRDARASVHSMLVRNVTVVGFDRTSHANMFAAWDKMISKMYDECDAVGREVCLPVHYETLVLNLREELERIFEFIDVPWSENVMQHEKLIDKEIRLSPREFSSSQVKKQVNPDALYTWVDYFPSEVLGDLAKIAPMMSKLGYDTTSSKPDYDKLTPL